MTSYSLETVIYTPLKDLWKGRGFRLTRIRFYREVLRRGTTLLNVTHTILEPVESLKIRGGEQIFTWWALSEALSLKEVTDLPKSSPTCRAPWKSRCSIEINVCAHFYKILLVIKLPYWPWVKWMPGKS